MIDPKGMETTFLLPEAETFRRENLSFDSARENPLFSSALRLWEEERQAGGFLPKSLITPDSFDTAALPNLVIIDIERDPLRFRYRLTGTAIDRVQNRNLTGRYVDENKPEELRDLFLNDLVTMAETGDPQFVELTFTNATGHRRHMHVLRLPVSGSNSSAHQVDHILMVVQFDPAPNSESPPTSLDV